MKLYDIFKSEGGYRVCLAMWGDDPIIDKCPWYKTEEDAKKSAKKSEFINLTNNMRMFRDGMDWIVMIREDFYTYDTKEEAKNRIVNEIKKFGYKTEYILENRKDLR